MSDDLYRLTACDTIARLKAGDITPLDAIDAALARIEAVDGWVNALPTLAPDRARDRARRLMDRPPAARGLLAGLPVAIKDLNPVAGVRTTYGSPIYADHVPAESDIAVLRIETAGGIVLAKSNTPEFGAGGQTFNEVFGATRNPWNTALTCAGSSGGAAAALATGQVWLAHGSDLGGSLRTPGAFCSVVGLRPSPGRVPRGPSDGSFNYLAVNGPMARNVADVALFLDVMAGLDPRDPLSWPAPATPYREALAAPVAPRRIAFSPDLGFMPVDPQVRGICARAMIHFENMGVSVEEHAPDFSGAMEAFHTLRAALFVTEHAERMKAHRDKFKPEILWNYDKGLALTAAEIAQAECARTAIFQRMAAFFAEFDLLACPTAAVPPYPIEQRYVDRIGDTQFDNYVDWMGLQCAVSVTSSPAISIPCGFTEDGRPVGLQLVARPRGEAELLQAAVLFEEAAGLHSLLPIDPRDPAS
ncbi:MAG: amidase family protein [Alphaproteobacteria bacterium]|nr:amidase family protein [Alphaproteobacteria bacterium]MCY4230434.1 amidase family protein [Alphaproteobacteria bacterium]MCY4319703.1 amidase family protein [Alphaproteobacteria bacterium]